MKEQFEQYLKRIDSYFEDKTKSTFQVYCAVIVLLIFAVAYLLYYEDMYYESESLFEQQQQSAEILENKKHEYSSYFGDLSMERAYVDGFVNSKIRVIAADIEKLRQEREIVENTRTFFRKKLNELSYLLFSNQKGAEFTKSLTELAGKYKLHINELRYENLSVGGSMQRVSPVLEVNLELFGEYRDIVRYINAIERSQMVVDVNSLNFHKFEDNDTTYSRSYNSSYSNYNNYNNGDSVKLNNKQVNVKMKISIWGVN